MTQIANPFVCDVCSKRRENDTNHWFVLRDLAGEDGPHQLVIVAWDDEWARKRDARHVCGQTCCLTLSERWLATRSFEGQKSPVETVQAT